MIHSNNNQNRQLILSFSPRDLTFERIHSYLHGIIQGEYIIKKGKSKGKKRQRRIFLNLQSHQDYINILDSTHVIEGFLLKVKPTLTKEERINLVQNKLKRRVYINNLPLDATHQDLEDIFGVFDNLSEVFVKLKKSKTDKRKRSTDIEGEGTLLAFVTFGSISGFQRCMDSGPVYYKDTNILLQLLEARSASPHSSESGYLIKVDKTNLKPLNQQQQQQLRQEEEYKEDMESLRKKKKNKRNTGNRNKIGDEINNNNNNSSPYGSNNSNPNTRFSGLSYMSLSFPFRFIPESEQTRNDWMGYQIIEKFSISQIALSKRQKLRHRKQTKKILFGLSNTRINIQSSGMVEKHHQKFRMIHFNYNVSSNRPNNYSLF